MTAPLKFSHITVSWRLLFVEAVAIAICLGLVFVLFEPGGGRGGDKTSAFIFMAVSVVLLGGGVLSGFGRSTYEIQDEGLLVTDTWLTPVSFVAPRGRTLIRPDEIASVWNSITTVRNKSRVYKYANGHIRTTSGREFKFSARVDTSAYMAKFVPFYEALRQRLPQLDLTPLPIEQA